MQALAAASCRPWKLWVGAFLYVFAVFGFNLMSCAPQAWVHHHGVSSDELVWTRLQAAHPPQSPPYLLRPATLPPCPIDLQAPRSHELFPASRFEAAWIYAPQCIDAPSAAYTSQAGLQGWALSAVFHVEQMLLAALPRADTRLVYSLWGLRLMQSALAAAVVAWITVFVAAEFGAWAYGLAVISVSFSPWLTVFAHSVYWQLWSLLLPFALSAWLCRAGCVRLWMLLGPLCVGLKATMGYEYLTTLTLSAAVPQVYYACKAQQPLRRTLFQCAAMGVLCVAAFAAVLMWHAAAVGQGSWEAGLRVVGERAAARTFPTSGTAGEGADIGKDASVIGCVFTYLLRFDTYGALYVPFIVWLGLFVGCARRLPQAQRRVAYVTLAAAVAAPMSWFVLAKGHSAAHPHLNFVLWHLPVTWFGWGFVGQAVQRHIRARGA